MMTCIGGTHGCQLNILFAEEHMVSSSIANYMMFHISITEKHLICLTVLDPNSLISVHI
jgi:hypothetical protein